MHKCKHCEKLFFFEGQLKRHIAFNHPKEAEDSELYRLIRDEVLEELVPYPPPPEHHQLRWINELPAPICDVTTRTSRTNTISRTYIPYPPLWHTIGEDLSAAWRTI